ncbi:hypothetical protein BKA80DRAFT_285407 [Phyllosticta citrichinensis]
MVVQQLNQVPSPIPLPHSPNHRQTAHHPPDDVRELRRRWRASCRSQHTSEALLLHGCACGVCLPAVWCATAVLLSITKLKAARCDCP